MATITARPDTGAVIKPGPMVTCPPARQARDEDFTGFAAGSGLHGPFLAEEFSAFLTHERMGVTLLRTLHTRSDNPLLRSRYGELESETLAAVDVWERLIRALGGNPQYISPAARMTETLDAKATEALLLSGSADPLTFERAGLCAYLAAASQCVVDTRILEALTHEADDGTARQQMHEAAGALAPSARAHAEWAAQALEKATVTQAKHPVARKLGDVAERVVGKIRSVVGPD